MKKIILTLMLIICVTKITAQRIDVAVENYALQIYEELKRNENITDNFETSKEFIYATKLKFPLNNASTKYFQIGTTSAHSYKYLGILYENKFILLPTKDYTKEYEVIVKPLKRIKKNVRLDEFVLFLEEIYEMYQYNTNPPWAEPKLIPPE